MIKLLHGDCRTESQKIKTGSVDLILTDPPYGTMDGTGRAFKKTFGDKFVWDSAIPPEELFSIAARLLRPAGRLVLFSQEPYTSQLIVNALPSLPFCYRMAWVKDTFANALGVNKAPVSYFEDVLVFQKVAPKHDFESAHPLRPYFEKLFSGLNRKSIIEKLGQRADHVTRYDSSQFTLCTEKTYVDILRAYKLRGRPWAELKSIDAHYRRELVDAMRAAAPSIFNLPPGKKHLSNVLNFPKDKEKLHPTQKPVALLSLIVETYTNPGGLVVDLTMGSGSTGAAVKRTGRRFVGIEQNKNFFDIATRRLKQ